MERRTNYDWVNLSELQKTHYLGLFVDGKTPRPAIASFFETGEEVIFRYLRDTLPALMPNWKSAPRRTSNIPFGENPDNYPPFNKRKR